MTASAPMPTGPQPVPAGPAEVPADVQRELEELAGAVGPEHTLLLALDFDGVLAPLQEDPDTSRTGPVAVAAVQRLATNRSVTVALVSGRALVDLWTRAQPAPLTLLVGSHGAERGIVASTGLEHVPVALSGVQQDRLDRLATGLDQIAAATPGVRVERKPAAVVLHTRTVREPRAAGDAARRALAVAATEGVEPLQGKEVVEISVLPVTKGQALTALRAELGSAVVLYAGDDVTDEHAFEALSRQDVTIKVGLGATAARLRVADTDVLAATLHRLADLLDGGAPSD